MDFGIVEVTLGHMTRGRVLMTGLETHSGLDFVCVNVHQTGYADSSHRNIIWENLSRTIRDSNL
jgi:microsomal dipeptidase-like Zn-dependent dipeptidase